MNNTPTDFYSTVDSDDRSKSKLPPVSAYCISDASANVERVNLTSIAYMVQMKSHDSNAHTQMRDGFELYIEHYNREDTPYTIDANGNCWVWPDVALFIIDHVTPTFEIVSIKRNIITGTAVTASEECCKEASLLIRYIVTGISNDNNEEPVVEQHLKDVKNISRLVLELISIFTQAWTG
jgi:hypothetical protein